MSMRIRQATPADADQVRELGNAAFGEQVGEKVASAVADVGTQTGILGTPHTRSVHAGYWVAEDEHGIIGIVGLYSPRWIGRQSLYLGWYCVLPGRQGQGVGTTLFEFAKGEARKLGARAILVETSPEPASVVAFYKRLGFMAVGECPDYWEDSSELLLMRLALESS